MLNTFNQSMLKTLQRMRRGGQYGNGGKTRPVGMVRQQFAPYTPPNNPSDIDYLRQHPEMMQAYDEMYRRVHGNTFTPSGGNSMSTHFVRNGFDPDSDPLAGFYEQMKTQYGDGLMTLPETELRSAGQRGNVMGDVNLGNAYDMYRQAKDTRNTQANTLLDSTQADYEANKYRFKGVRGAFNSIFARKKLKNFNDKWMGNMQQITNLKQDNSFKRGGSVGAKPYWAPTPGMPANNLPFIPDYIPNNDPGFSMSQRRNPRYNQAAIAHDQMYEPAPGTIGPPGYPTFDNNNGMGVMAPQTSTPVFAPPAVTGPTMAEVTSNYQPTPAPAVNQRHFGSAFSQARQAGLKTFDFRGKSYTTDLRSDVGKQAAQKATVSHAQTAFNLPSNMTQAERVSAARQLYPNGNIPTNITMAELTNLASQRGRKVNIARQAVGSNGNSVPAVLQTITGTPAKGKNVNFLLPNRPIQPQGKKTYNWAEKTTNSYNAGKTFLDLRGKEKQFAPLAAADAALTFAARQFGAPVARTISGKGSTSDKVQTALSVLPYTKPLKYAGKAAQALASKIPGTATKIYPYTAPATQRMLGAAPKMLNAGASRMSRTVNSMSKGLPAASKATKPLVTPYQGSQRTFYGAKKGLTQVLKKVGRPSKTVVKSTKKLFE